MFSFIKKNSLFCVFTLVVGLVVYCVASDSFRDLYDKTSPDDLIKQYGWLETSFNSHYSVRRSHDFPHNFDDLSEWKSFSPEEQEKIARAWHFDSSRNYYCIIDGELQKVHLTSQPVKKGLFSFLNRQDQCVVLAESHTVALEDPDTELAPRRYVKLYSVRRDQLVNLDKPIPDSYLMSQK